TTRRETLPKKRPTREEIQCSSLTIHIHSTRDLSSLRCHRTDDYGQLVRCPSVLYYIADKYDKELEKNRLASKGASDRDIASKRASEQAPKTFDRSRWQRPPRNKLRRKRELEIYNARKANFKRFATDRMIGLGRHRNIVDPATLQNK
ncbi:hypothetical protein COOONC_23971, partial [Cooperia oncophora]